MKRNLFFFFSLLLVALLGCACNMKSVISPSVKVPDVVYRTSIAGVTDTITLSDSLAVGDTVRMPLILNGYYDYLTSFTVSADTSKVSVSCMWGDELNHFLNPNADPEHGILAFKPDSVYSCLTTLVYVPRVSGTHRIDLSLTSSAELSYSQWTGHFFIGVK